MAAQNPVRQLRDACDRYLAARSSDSEERLAAIRQALTLIAPTRKHMYADRSTHITRLRAKGWTLDQVGALTGQSRSGVIQAEVRANGWTETYAEAKARKTPVQTG